MRLSPEQRFVLRSWYRKWGANLFQLVVAFVIALGSIYFYVHVGLSLELFILEKFYQIRGAKPAPQDIAIVAIDDETYKELGLSTKFPVPRKYIADALEVLQKNNPRLLTLDANLPHEPTIDPEADARIAAVLRSTPSTIWSGQISESDFGGDKGVAIPSGENFRSAAKLELPMTLHTILHSVAYIADPRVQESDLIKRVPIAKALVELVGITPKTPGATDLINFYGPAGTIQRLSLARLLKDPPSEISRQLNGKLILVGYQSAHYGRTLMGKDEYPTPPSPNGMFGVEIHANAIGNLLDGSWHKRLDLLTELTIIALASFLMASYTLRAPTPLTIIAVWVTLALAIVAAYIGFAYYAIWFGGLGTIITVAALVTTLSATYFYRRAQDFKAYLDRTFAFEREREL